MKCPVCHVGMVLHEREGVEIDFCRECGGIFLDEEELDLIVRRSPASGEEEDAVLDEPERGRDRSRKRRH